MKKWLVALCMFLMVPFVNGQGIDFTVKSGEAIKFKMSDFATGIYKLGVINGNAYFLFLPYSSGGGLEISMSGKNHFIGKFDLDNKLIKKTEIELKQNKKDLVFEGALLLKDQIFVFSSFQNKKEKKHFLFVQNFDPNTVELVDNIRPVAELSYSEFSKFNYAPFWFQVSPDSSKVLIYYSLQTSKSEILRSGFNVYGSDLKLIWGKEDATARFSEGIIGYYRVKVDNDGGVYVAVKHYTDKSNYYDAARFSTRGFFSKDIYFTDMPNYTFEFCKYTQQAPEPVNYSMAIPGKFIRSVNFSTSDNNIITCFGVYAAPGRISVDGSFSFNLDLDSKQTSQLFTSDFSKDLLSHGLNDNELRRFRRSIENKQEWDPYDYWVSDMKTRQNGERYFIAEQVLTGYKKVTQMQGTKRVVTLENIYLHNDLFLVSLKSDNQVRRTDKITKRQYWLSTNRFNSYASVEKNNNLYFLYNTFDSKDGMFSNVEIGDSYITRVKENGDQAKTIFKKKSDDKEPFPLLMTAINVSEGSLMYGLFPFNNRRYQFERIFINDK
ncbi:MAG: hypothetical protein NT040_13245 [Bacteroidetes bacterium]|nr:hypothetical protein [Bacteroidota bacterium]